MVLQCPAGITRKLSGAVQDTNDVGSLKCRMNTTEFFTPESINADGGVTMLGHADEDRKLLYLTNGYGQKLLKIAVKNEVSSKVGHQYAQIKIIPYGIKRAVVWRDLPSDPLHPILHDDVTLTYHGGSGMGQTPKVHVKATTGYRTLIDDSLDLPSDLVVPVPVFSLETGFTNQRELVSPITKKCHCLPAGSQEPVRFDVYISSVSIDVAAFVNSIYFFNLFWTQEYLIASQNHPLSSGLIIAPIMFFRMGDYMVVVRRSLSKYNGRPKLHFYNNKSYYEKLMNRKTATLNTDGSLDWSTMAQDEASLQERLARS